MSFTPKDNTGALFPNERKEKDTHADRQGTAMIDGKEYYVNGWLKDGKNGRWLSLSFKPKERQERRQESKSRRRDDLPDDIPF